MTSDAHAPRDVENNGNIDAEFVSPPSRAPQRGRIKATTKRRWPRGRVRNGDSGGPEGIDLRTKPSHLSTWYRVSSNASVPEDRGSRMRESATKGSAIPDSGISYSTSGEDPEHTMPQNQGDDKGCQSRQNERLIKLLTLEKVFPLDH